MKILCSYTWSKPIRTSLFFSNLVTLPLTQNNSVVYQTCENYVAFIVQTFLVLLTSSTKMNRQLDAQVTNV